MTTQLKKYSVPGYGPETETAGVETHLQMQSDYTPGFAAHSWLSRGFHLLPIQPGTKKIMSGFGQYQTRIKTLAESAHWWGNENKKFNMAVVCNGGNFILDFDDYEIFTAWIKTADENFTLSYRELSPRGAHVFLNGPLPVGLKLIKGVEIKKVCLVVPSVVNGVPYTRAMPGEIFSGDLTNCFSSLSAFELSPAVTISPAETRLPIMSPNDLVSDIKSRVSCVDVLRKFAPGAYESLKGSERFRSARCPFHKAGQEVKHSFWIDTELNTWGCHAESITGDVINLYGLLVGKTNKESIKELYFWSRNGVQK
jgi:hypothetical protein